MTPTTALRPARRTAADTRARWSALVSGAAGVVANVLLVLFFALAAPFSAEPSALSWLGPANDWVMVPQFLALVPVALAVGRRLPARRSMVAVTAVGGTAMAATAVAQLLLVTGLLAFDIEVVLVVAAMLLIYLWLIAVSLAGHRSATLPRPVTRIGLLLGTSVPAGAALVAAGLLVPEPARWALFVPGLAIGGAGWLALPVVPLLIARHVLKEER
jgi:hypothetical protein